MTMTQDVILRLGDAQARMVDELVEPWKADHDAAMRADSLERLLPRLILLCESTRELYRIIWKSLFAGHVKGLEEFGRAARSLFDHILAALDSAVEACRKADGLGYPIRDFPVFEQSVEEVRRANRDFNDRWPWINLERIAQSAAGFERGESQDARAFFDELLRQSEQVRPSEDPGLGPVRPPST